MVDEERIELLEFSDVSDNVKAEPKAYVSEYAQQLQQWQSASSESNKKLGRTSPKR